MATLTYQIVTVAGLDPTYQAAAGGGDKVRPGDRVFLHVKNDGGGSVTVTIADPRSVEPTGATAFDPDVEVVIEPSGERLIGPIVEDRFRDNSDLLAHITYSGVSSVTVAALKL